MDIAELLRPLADNAPPPPPMDHVVERARHRRRQRATRVAAVVLVVLIGAAGFVVVTRHDDTTTRVAAGQGTTTTSGGVAAAPVDRIAITKARPIFGPGLATAEIYLVDADGSGEVQVSHAGDTGHVASQPAWSPDRRLLAYIESTPEGAINAGAGNLVIANADGTNPVRITNMASDTGPTWAPDSHGLAFARFDNG